MFDALKDDQEEMILSKRKNVYEFMGWRFPLITTTQDGITRIYLSCYKRLRNPEAPNLEMSCAWISFTELDRLPEWALEMKKKEAAAWLIAHWWEHYCNICPCQNGVHDDERGSTFRQALIRSLLWYDRHVTFA